MTDELVPGFTNPRAVSLDRYLIRTREGTTTQAAWRLSATSGEGEGAIIFLEISPGQSVYRGEGIFLGWPPDRLEAAYRALQPSPEDDGFATNQLG